MKVLLDTNILIHREAASVIRDDIGELFRWLDQIGAEKYVHPHSIDEIRKHQDPQLVKSFEIKLSSYNVFKTLTNDPPNLKKLRESDISNNDIIDTNLLCEVANNRVDFLITEDRGIHQKAKNIGLCEKIVTIDDFLERMVRENPDLVEYPVLSVKKQYFGEIDVSDSFFDTFRRDYPGFNNWFIRKSDEVAYTCMGKDGRVLAFLYVKVEKPGEVYSDINPHFSPKHRLKIGTFKVVLNGFKLGERFIKIVFDNSLTLGVDEVYVTIFDKTDDQQRLIRLLEEWGFKRYGTKTTCGGTEGVWVRDLCTNVIPITPSFSYPFLSKNARKYIVPIYPAYHTELLPDSILRTESPMDFEENRPNRNAIRKAYISRSYFRDLVPGDIIVFYRTGSGTAPAHHTAVATSLGIVESVHLNIHSFEHFREVCGSVSVFSDSELKEHWDYNPRNRPFVVRFLHVYSFPKRPNLATMKNNGVLDSHPRGFESLTDEGFNRLMELANADQRIIVN